MIIMKPVIIMITITNIYEKKKNYPDVPYVILYLKRIRNLGKNCCELAFIFMVIFFTLENEKMWILLEISSEYIINVARGIY